MADQDHPVEGRIGAVGVASLSGLEQGPSQDGGRVEDWLARRIRRRSRTGNLPGGRVGLEARGSSGPTSAGRPRGRGSGRRGSSLGRRDAPGTGFPPRPGRRGSRRGRRSDVLCRAVVPRIAPGLHAEPVHRKTDVRLEDSLSRSSVSRRRGGTLVEGRGELEDLALARGSGTPAANLALIVATTIAASSPWPTVPRWRTSPRKRWSGSSLGPDRTTRRPADQRSLRGRPARSPAQRGRSPGQRPAAGAQARARIEALYRRMVAVAASAWARGSGPVLSGTRNSGSSRMSGTVMMTTLTAGWASRIVATARRGSPRHAGRLPERPLPDRASSSR